MGRIAEALKRAQQERERLGDDGGEPAAVVEPTSGVVSGRPKGRRTGRVPGSDPLSRASILDVPSLSKLAPIEGPIIEPAYVDRDVVTFHDPESAFAEKYRSVRTRLLTDNAGGMARIFAVTSSQPKEGKTVTAANLGFALAELRHLRVAVIDLDFRRRGLSRRFQVDDRAGLAEVLRGEKKLAEVCARVVKDNLVLVPAGDPGDSVLSDLLASSRATAVFKEFNQRFHYTLVDTPPVNTAADIGSIAPLCHSVIMVIRMNRTPESLLKRSVKLLEANHLSIAGCILAGYCESTMGYTDPHDYYESEA